MWHKGSCSSLGGWAPKVTSRPSQENNLGHPSRSDNASLSEEDNKHGDWGGTNILVQNADHCIPGLHTFTVRPGRSVDLAIVWNPLITREKDGVRDCSPSVPIRRWLQTLRKRVWRFLGIFKIELPYDPAVPLLGIYPEEMTSGSRRDNCTLMLIAALFTMAELWEQLKRLFMD